MSKPSIILASTSTTRKHQLNCLGIPFQAIAPTCDETPLIGEFAPDTALRLAKNKAYSLKAKHKNSIIIGADQVALLNGQQLGKPLTIDNAKIMLANMSEQSIEFYSALCVLHSDFDHCQTHIDLTCVTMRTLTYQQIEHYLDKEPDAIYCAGAAKSEGLGAALIERIDSCDPNALLGLPIFKLVEFLNNEGIDII
ncbi:Maf family protein [Neisseria sp. Ec49-e6-T10]|uniref:Maf family protein n=1 Tax=Neisseria sp. Ec49-e6-T10 TaxID=3140744 RepID=UPI003EC09889